MERKKRSEFRRLAAAAGASSELKQRWARIHSLELPGCRVFWDLHGLAQETALSNLRFRFGLPPAKLYRNQVKEACPKCRKPWDKLKRVGEWHLVDCQQHLERSIRHNAVRGAVRAAVSPLPAETVVESPFPGGDFNSRADLRVERTDSKGKNVVELLDFQITNPLSASRYISPESHLTPILKYAETQKRRKYRQEMTASRKLCTFTPFIVSVHGGFGDEALLFIDRMSEFINLKRQHIDVQVWRRDLYRAIVRIILESNHRSIVHGLSLARDRSL